MTEEVKERRNGKRPEPDTDLPADFAQWPTANEVANQVKTSVRTVMRLVDQGVLRCLRDRDGVKRFDPALVTDYRLARSNFGTGVEDDEEDKISLESRRSEESRKDRQLNSTLKRLDAANELVDILITGVQRFVNIVAAPAERMLDKHDQFSKRIIERNEYLETLAFKMLKAQEEALTEREVRELAKQVHSASEQRKTDAWKLIMNRAPRLLDQIEASVLDKNPQAKKQVQAAIELLSSPEITPEMLDVIREFLSDKNKELLDQILDPDGSKKKKAAAAEKPTAAAAATDSGSAEGQPQTTDTKTEKEASS